LALLERLAHRAKGRARGIRAGEGRSRPAGTGGELVSCRPYVAGDDLRQLDWHAVAPLDALFTKLYEVPRTQGIHLLLDSSASMGCGKSSMAAQLTAAIGTLAMSNLDTAGICLLREELAEVVGPLRGDRGVRRLLTFVNQVRFTGGTNLHRSVAEFVRARPHGSVVLITDFLVTDGRREALEALGRAKIPTAVIHLLSAEERNPEVGGDVLLVDSETQRELKVSVTPGLKAAYLARLAGLTEELRAACRTQGFAFFAASTGGSIENLLFGDARGEGVLASIGTGATFARGC
jgi:uncharacterized protein (DUF58 family)